MNFWDVFCMFSTKFVFDADPDPSVRFEMDPDPENDMIRIQTQHRMKVGAYAMPLGCCVFTVLNSYYRYIF